MTKTEVRIQQKFTRFGILWVIISPLVQMVVLGFVFTFFIKNPVPNYHYYLLLGLLVWNYFSSSLSKSVSSIVVHRSLLKKTRFTYTIIPVSIVLSNFFNLVLVLIFLFVPVFFLGTLSAFSGIYIVAGLITLLTITIGSSLFVSAFNVRHRGLGLIMQVLLTIWFYATPIVYTLDIIPETFRWLWVFNPIILPISLLQNGYLGTELPYLWISLANLFLILLIMVIGINVFKMEAKRFDDWL